MRIAHIVCAYPPYYSGMGSVVFQMCEELGKRGHEVEVFTPGYYERKEIRTKEAPVARKHEEILTEQIATVRRLTPSISYGNAARLPTIEQELDGFDLVHLHYPFFGTANLVRRWKRRHPDRPLVITYHMDTRASGWKGLVFRAYAAYWMPKILDSANLVIASSFDYIAASDARNHFETHKEKWMELPFGVDLDRFFPRERPAYLFERLELNPSLPVLLFVGGMDEAHYFKGIPVLLRSLFLLKKEEINFSCIFVGDGSLRDRWEHEAEVLGMSESVRFVGRISDDELPLYYNMADLFVLPSIHQGEAFGMVLLEAMASGVPVIATNIPGVRAVAEKAGVVVPPKNPAVLSGRIAEFFIEENDQAKWRDRVRRVAEEHYAWEPIVERLEEAYNSLIAKPK